MDVHGGAGAVFPPAVERGYRLGPLLGGGSRARVWLAVREDDGARFALKIPTAELAGRRSTFETRRELNILSRFGHENLLHLYTLLDTDQGPGLLMEYAPGQSLTRLAEARGPLTPGEAVTVLAGIGSALGYLHDQGVAHGDISPGNILFTAHGKPLLADLGMDRLTGTGGGGAPGPSEFRDPAAGAEPDGPALRPESDVYSLAAVGWFALTGHLPPGADHRTAATMTTAATAAKAAAAGIPAALREALEAGLHPDPLRRPDAAAFSELVLAGAPFEPLDLALPLSAGHPAAGERQQLRRRDRPRRGRRTRNFGGGPLPDQLGLDPLVPVRHRWFHLGLLHLGLLHSSPSPAWPAQHALPDLSSSRARRALRGAGRERGHRSRLALTAAALLVAATMGLGAVAVAAPELLAPRDPGVAGDAERAGDPGIAEDPGAVEDAGSGEGQAVGEGGVEGDPGAEPSPSVPEPEPSPSAPAPEPAPDPPGDAAAEAPPAPEREPGDGPLSGAAAQELERLQHTDNPVRAVPALAELRARAFLAGDAAALETVNVPGSPAMAADAAELARFLDAGTVLSGLAVEVLSAGPAAPAGSGAGRVRIPATVSTSAYSERTARGGTVRTVAALPGQELVLVLAPGPDGWRIEDILTPP